MFTYAGIAVIENPPTSDDEEFIVLADGFSDQELAAEEVDESLLHFAMLVVWRSADWQSAQAQIREQHESETSRILSLDLVSDDVCHLTRRVRRLSRELEPESGFRYNYKVGFRKECDSAQAAAFTVIRMAVLRKRWQFWR